MSREKAKAWLAVGKTLALITVGYVACDTGAVKFNMPQAQATQPKPLSQFIDGEYMNVNPPKPGEEGLY